MKSIIQDQKRCFNCGATQPLHLHHIFNGYGLRKKSDEDGLTVYLCAFCHNQVHMYKEKLNFLKRIGERKYLENHSYEEYMKRYHTNYLEDDELDLLTFNSIGKSKDENDMSLGKVIRVDRKVGGMEIVFVPNQNFWETKKKIDEAIKKTKIRTIKRKGSGKNAT